MYCSVSIDETDLLPEMPDFDGVKESEADEVLGADDDVDVEGRTIGDVLLCSFFLCSKRASR